jgi:HlyD family secretion protein
MKRKRWLWIGAGVVVVGVLVAANLMRQSKGKVESVQIAKVRVEDVTAMVRAPGKIEPRVQVKVSADIMGKIVRLAVKEGDRVRKGQLMLQLDDAQYRSSAQQAQAALASARARLNEARSSSKVVEANYARQRALFDQRLLSPAEWDQATANVESSRSAVLNAQEDVTRTEAALNAARDNLSKTRFEAPFDGVVSALNVEAGEVVIMGTMNNPGTQILVVSDLSRMLVRADVDETDVIEMRIGQKAKITVDALPDTSFAGTVVEIGSTAKRTAGATLDGQTNFEVEVVFDHDVPQVRPGMTADVEIETATHAKTTAVPVQAVVVRTQRDLDLAAKKASGKKERRKKGGAESAEDDTVGRKDPEITGVFAMREGKAAFVPVKTGISSETMLEVFGELKAGESVVSGPYKALRELKPGTKIKAEVGGGDKRKG